MNNREAIAWAMQAIEGRGTITIVRQKAKPTNAKENIGITDAHAWNVLNTLCKII